MELISEKTRSQQAEFGEKANITLAAKFHVGMALPFILHLGWNVLTIT
jgi:hypothetical protein